MPSYGFTSKQYVGCSLPERKREKRKSSTTITERACSIHPKGEHGSVPFINHVLESNIIFNTSTPWAEHCRMFPIIHVLLTYYKKK